MNNAKSDLVNITSILLVIVMALVIMVNKLKGLFLFFVNIFRRAMCCFRRRRKHSFDSVPLTTVGIVSNENIINPDAAESWNNWDDTLESIKEDKPATVKDHIEYFRQQAIAARQLQQQRMQEQQEPNEDFFEDMTPKIIRQTKYVINNRNDTNEQFQTPSGHLSLAPETISGGDLGEWEEGAGWESEALDWDAQSALREKKRQEREQRRQERVTLGAKIS